MSSDLITKKDDPTLDLALRPAAWNEYIGQEKIKNNLHIIIEAARQRSEPIEHILLYGPAGLGKTTLANLIAREMGSSIKITSGPAIEKAGDLAAILTNMQEHDILFIDEVHRLNKTVAEMLYPAMENNVLDIIIGKGPSARTLQLQLPRFTLIAATTKAGALSAPFRSRFGATYKLEFYTPEEIGSIIKRSSRLLNANIDKEAVSVIAQASRFTPRIANRILKRVRDYAQVKNNGLITGGSAKEALAIMEIDHLGLESTDIKILETIIMQYNGGPVGLKTIATSAAEEIETIEDLYEPYLLQIGFLSRSLKGRIATEAAYHHLKKEFRAKESQGTLL